MLCNNEFTKEEKRLAKQVHNANLEVNPKGMQEGRYLIAARIMKSKPPTYDCKVTIL